MHSHQIKLKELCRLCGQGVKQESSCEKTCFATELLQRHNIDIYLDSTSIHPTQLCNACRCSLRRYRNTPTKKRKISQQHDTPVTFVEHSHNCDLCYPDCNVDSFSDQTPLSKVDKIFTEFKTLSFDEKKDLLQKQIDNVKEEIDLKSKIEEFKGLHPYNDKTSLSKFDLKEYFDCFDDFIVELLFWLFGKSKVMNSLPESITVMECMYRLFDSSFIGQWSFLQNIVIFSASKNKNVCNIFGTSVPAAKFSTLSNFLSDIESTEETPCPEGDVIFMFDNEQVIGRNWNIRVKNRIKSSIITNVAVAAVHSHDDTESIQTVEELMPGKWLKSAGNEDTILKLCDETLKEEVDDQDNDTPFFEKLKSVHYEELYRQIDFVINLTEEQLYLDDKTGNFMDNIDQIVKELEELNESVRCPKCNLLLEKNKRKCPVCHILMSEYRKNQEVAQKESEEEEKSKKCTAKLYEKRNNKGLNEDKQSLESVYRYEHITSNHISEGVDVSVLDPVLANPNSIENILYVLRHIGKKAGIKRYVSSGKRYWTVICCDGLPHSLVRRLIEEYLHCSECDVGCLGIKEMEKHAKKVHGGEVSFYYEFDWVLLLTGDGHYEMNLVKSFMELNWEVFMKNFAQKMGWISEAAQKSAKKCSDNHKAWQMILTFHIGTMCELVIPYVAYEKGRNENPSAEGYLTYVKKQGYNSNYMYLFEMVCKYTQGIVNFRMATRRNNWTLLQSAKWMTKELFHGRSHPKYQDIEIYDQFVQHIMPEKVKQFVRLNATMSKTGHPSKGQGYDFILEEENKSLKIWLKRGTPTDKMWFSTCRNHQYLKQIRDHVFSQIKSQSITDGRNINLDEEIFEWRLQLRKTGFLYKYVALTSISGDILCPDLSKFTSDASRKRSYRILDMLLQQEPPSDPTLNFPVYVTYAEQAEYLSFHNLCIRDIDVKIKEGLERIQDEEAKKTMEEFFQTTIKKKRCLKEDHLHVLQTVNEIIENQTEMTIQQPDCNDNDNDDLDEGFSV